MLNLFVRWLNSIEDRVCDSVNMFIANLDILLRVLEYYCRIVRWCMRNVFANDFFDFCKFLFFFFFSKFAYRGTGVADLTVVDHADNKSRSVNFFFKKIGYVRFEVYIYIFMYLDNKQLFFSFNVLSFSNFPSLFSLFNSTVWLERECWDMFGVFFIGNRVLRRILTDYGFVGFPLRKDFPVIGYLEMRYDGEESSLLYGEVNMMQEMRLWRRILN
jgi:NADH:ubiquinone oxidoreductase subunit C